MIVYERERGEKEKERKTRSKRENGTKEDFSLDSSVVVS